MYVLTYLLDGGMCSTSWCVWQPYFWQVLSVNMYRTLLASGIHCTQPCESTVFSRRLKSRKNHPPASKLSLTIPGRSRFILFLSRL